MEESDRQCYGPMTYHDLEITSARLESFGHQFNVDRFFSGYGIWLTCGCPLRDAPLARCPHEVTTRLSDSVEQANSGNVHPRPESSRSE